MSNHPNQRLLLEVRAPRENSQKEAPNELTNKTMQKLTAKLPKGEARDL